MNRLPLLLIALAAGLTLLTSAAPGLGDGFPTGGPGALPTRDIAFGGSFFGDWFQRTCALPSWGGASCQAQVVTDANGQPLAGSSPPASAFGPRQLEGAYNLPTTAPTAQTVAIVDAYGDPNIASDLASFDSQFGLPSMTSGPPSACGSSGDCFEVVNENGSTSALPAENAGWDLEISLDVDTVHSVCQNCNIILVEASSANFNDLGAAENEGAALGANVITNSWGGSEFGGESSYDSYFTHPHVAITASAGDSGYGVEYPAASPDVTAVGGTSLKVVTNSSPSGYGYGGESAWSGSGSGCSSQESKPSWQGAVSTGCGMRAVADISADADPNTGVAVYDSVSYDGQSGWFQVGGTSLSAQIIGAVYALTGATSSLSGSAATPLYSAPAGALHDVTSGSNGSCSPAVLCTASTGWDGPTGLGSPNGLVAFENTPPAPGFTLSASPTTVNVSTGSSNTTTVTANPTNGFSGSVSYSASGTPSGVTATFNPTSSSTSSTLTFAASSTASAGSYTITVTGTSGSVTATSQVTLVVAASSFTLSASPTTLSVNAGSSTTTKVSVNPSNGFSGSVSFTASGLPSGVTASFSPTSSTSSSTLTLASSSSTSSGSYPITVTGTSGSLSATTQVTLVVTVPSFTLSASPTSLTVNAGSSNATTVSVNPANGFNGSVSFSASGLPSGVTASFSPTASTSSATLTLTASSSPSAGTYSVTVTGQSGSLSASTSVALTVVVPTFTLSASPSSQSISSSGSANYTISVGAVGGFSGSVSLSVTGLPSGVSARLSSNPVSPGGSTTLTLRASGARSGSTKVTITGTSGGLTATTSVTLTVSGFSFFF